MNSESHAEGHAASAADLFVDGGEMGALMRSLDWSQTPAGPVSEWPQSLRTALGICLGSRHPIEIWWGPNYLRFYNDAYRPILGQTKHPQYLGYPGRECWAEIWDVISPMLDSVRTTGIATWSENFQLIMTRNGYVEETYFTFSYSPIRDESGGVGGIFCACSETTQQVLSERRLKTLRELAASTMKAKTVTHACRIAMETLSRNKADIPFALLYLADPDPSQAHLVETAGIPAGQSASPVQVDLSLATDVWHLGQVKATGQAKRMMNLAARWPSLPGGVWPDPCPEALVMPLAQSDQNQLGGWLVMGISPRRAFDDEYQGFFDLVASHVATAIANAQAYEAERQRVAALAELGRARTAFFSNVSHEFRTPLTLMLSPLEELSHTLKDRLQPDEREQLQLIQRNGLRLQKLVNTLLDFSRIEAGRVQAVYEPVDLAAFTTELASVFRSLMEQAGLTLVIDCPTLPEQVYVDRDMWEKIVLNLLSNAFKFTFAGQITVRVCAVKGAAEFSVSDTGVGIPESELPKLFERFHRVSGTRARTYEGSGIGLALVQELVKLHGGTIQVTSQVDQGTTFTVTIPFGTAHLPPDHVHASRPMSSTSIGAAPFIEEAWRWIPNEAHPQGNEGSKQAESNLPTCSTRQALHQPRILLADDNADMRDYVKRLLSSRFIVETAANGNEALTTIHTNPPDLVLTDVMMPEMDGFELLRSLRHDPITQDIPVILLSARAGEEARMEGLAAGADDYLIKPFSARELLARIESTLKLTQLRQEATYRERLLRQETIAVQNRLSELLESMTDAFIALDVDWRIVYQNAAAERINRKPRSQVLGKTHWEEWPASVGTAIEHQYRRAMAEQIPVHFEHHYYSPSDYDLWLEIHAYPSPEGLSVFYRDITQRKGWESALQESEERFRMLADHISQFAWMANETGWIFWYNRRWFEYTGTTLEEMQGEGWQQVHHPDHVERVVEYFRHCIATGQPWEDLFPLRGQDGQYRWFLSRALPIRDEAGKILRWFGTNTDVTEQQKASAEREELLAREQAAREQAETANRIKDEFLAVLSHELRSPLNPILGWSKLLRSRSYDPTTTERALETIERNARLQAQLVDDLLDISRILRGKLSLVVTQVNLELAIRAALETVRLAAEAKSIEIETALEPDFPRLLGDANRLQQVIWNLLSNAVKFTPKQGRVIVTLQQLDGYAELRVSDTGIGIAPNFLPYLFESFRQADSSTTRLFGGLGLGLAIARQIVELHGGTIAAESPGIDQGSTFVIRLPLRPDSQAMYAATEPTNAIAPVTKLLAGATILLVEDEADARNLLTFMLEEAGASVTAVESATAALETVQQQKPDLLISDIGMPNMDGYMLMRQVREMEPPNQSLPAIALTAYAAEIDQQQALAAGFQHHIPKPVDFSNLIQTIQTLIQPTIHKPL